MVASHLALAALTFWRSALSSLSLVAASMLKSCHSSQQSTKHTWQNVSETRLLRVSKRLSLLGLRCLHLAPMSASVSWSDSTELLTSALITKFEVCCSQPSSSFRANSCESWGKNSPLWHSDSVLISLYSEFCVT